MTVALIGLAVLAVVIFAFVLEPVIRARADRVVLDAVAEPRSADAPADESALVTDSESDAEVHGRVGDRDTPPRVPVAVDRPVAGDAS